MQGWPLHSQQSLQLFHEAHLLLFWVQLVALLQPVGLVLKHIEFTQFYELLLVSLLRYGDCDVFHRKFHGER